MDFTIRKGAVADTKACAAICFNAFNTISCAHNFPPDMPNEEMAIGFIGWMLMQPHIHCFVAEAGGKILGSNFLWEGDTIAGIGPITVDPLTQNRGAGRRLMEAALERVDKIGKPGVRLVQAAFHNRSLSLYTSLGFEVREPLACIQGTPLKKQLPGFPLRKAVPNDAAACDALCRNVHGHVRAGEVAAAINQGKASVVERGGKITAYTTGISFFSHTVAETNDDLKALIAAAPEFGGPGFLLPTRNGELFRWCLNEGLRVTQPLTLMSRGLYNEPAGAFLPSILF